MTSRGLEMPPDQKASHTRSILFLRSPVITGVGYRSPANAPHGFRKSTEGRGLPALLDVVWSRQLLDAVAAGHAERFDQATVCTRRATPTGTQGSLPSCSQDDQRAYYRVLHEPVLPADPR